jgi:hypothetical protein
MARSFTQASGDYGEYAGAVVAAAPLTLACWFNSVSTTLTQFLISIGNSGSAAKFALSASGATGGDPIQAFASGNSASINGYNANVWNHAAAIFESTTSRYAVLNGTFSAQNTTSTTPAGLNRTAVGRRNDSTPGSTMSGRIAEAGIWNVALSQAEITMLSIGISPLKVRPGSLVAYWPLKGIASPEQDLVGRFELTLTGSAVGDHARVFNPEALWTGKAAAVAASKVPLMMDHYRRLRV